MDRFFCAARRPVLLSCVQQSAENETKKMPDSSFKRLVISNTQEVTNSKQK